mmetsp:Transcript_19945/g.47583  ORF Transcript_19945/g.47583 Transcript_19945/m.47583 type:complete len:218 (-) Transcript_19945:62-715(-)
MNEGQCGSWRSRWKRRCGSRRIDDSTRDFCCPVFPRFAGSGKSFAGRSLVFFLPACRNASPNHRTAVWPNTENCHLNAGGMLVVDLPTNCGCVARTIGVASKPQPTLLVFAVVPLVPYSFDERPRFLAFLASPLPHSLLRCALLCRWMEMLDMVLVASYRRSRCSCSWACSCFCGRMESLAPRADTRSIESHSFVPTLPQSNLRTTLGTPLEYCRCC